MFQAMRETRRDGFPPSLVHYREILQPGQMIPVNMGEAGVALVVREHDLVVRDMSRKPMVYAIPGTIFCGNVRLLWLLVRITEVPSRVYETGFDITRPNCVVDLRALCSQPKILLQVVGNSEWTSIEVEMKELQRQLRDNLEKALRRGPTWTGEEFLLGVEVLRAATYSPADLWKIFEREGQMVEIQLPN